MIMSDQDLDDILREIIRFTDSQIPFSACSILLLSKQNTYFSSVLSHRLPERMTHGYLGMQIRRGNAPAAKRS